MRRQVTVTGSSRATLTSGVTGCCQCPAGKANKRNLPLPIALLSTCVSSVCGLLSRMARDEQCEGKMREKHSFLEAHKDEAALNWRGRPLDNLLPRVATLNRVSPRNMPCQKCGVDYTWL